MIQLQQNLFVLGFLVFVLGFRHGFDADHLAAIDGLTRYNSRRNPTLSRYCGTFFSLGHGCVVVFISLLVSTAAVHWNVPSWLESFGDWVSIVFLVFLGMLNLHAVVTAGPGEIVLPVGLKGRFFGRISHAGSPGLVALVGALFAISFDTISQAALFSMTASRFGGWQSAVLMGLLFMLGMLFTDGINGLWISRLLARVDRMALFASRMMGIVVSILSLSVAAFWSARLAFPFIDHWSEGKETVFGVCLIGIVITSYIFVSRAPARG